MTIGPDLWLELARQGARKAGATGADLDDAAAHALEAFVKQPPATPGEAVNRAQRRAIDWLRSWYGDTRIPSGRRKRDTKLEAADPIAFAGAGADDLRLELVARMADLASAGLTFRELEAIAARVAGYGAAELDRMRGLEEGATRQALKRARAKVTFRT